MAIAAPTEMAWAQRRVGGLQLCMMGMEARGHQSTAQQSFTNHYSSNCRMAGVVGEPRTLQRQLLTNEFSSFSKNLLHRQSTSSWTSPDEKTTAMARQRR
jgi:hypothetical protein